MSNVMLGGARADGRTWAFYETNGCGMGARPNDDGIDGIQCHMTNTLEHADRSDRTRVSVARRALRDRRRNRRCRPLPRRLRSRSRDRTRRRHRRKRSLLADRHTLAPAGAQGGEPGTCGRHALMRDGRETPLRAKATLDARTRRRARRANARRRRLRPTPCLILSGACVNARAESWCARARGARARSARRRADRRRESPMRRGENRRRASAATETRRSARANRRRRERARSRRLASPPARSRRRARRSRAARRGDDRRQFCLREQHVAECRRIGEAGVHDARHRRKRRARRSRAAKRIRRDRRNAARVVRRASCVRTRYASHPAAMQPRRARDRSCARGGAASNPATAIVSLAGSKRNGNAATRSAFAQEATERSRPTAPRARITAGAVPSPSTATPGAAIPERKPPQRRAFPEPRVEALPGRTLPRTSGCPKARSAPSRSSSAAVASGDAPDGAYARSRRRLPRPFAAARPAATTSARKTSPRFPLRARSGRADAAS